MGCPLFPVFFVSNEGFLNFGIPQHKNVRGVLQGGYLQVITGVITYKPYKWFYAWVTGATNTKNGVSTNSS